MTKPQGDLPDYLATVGATVALLWSGRLSSGSQTYQDATPYNSVLIAISQDPGVGPVACYYQWLDLTGIIVDAGVLSANISTALPNGSGPSWVLPVRGSRLMVGNDLPGQDIDVRIDGQPSYSEWRMNNDGDPSRPFQTVITAAAPVNTVFPFASSLAAGLAAPTYPKVTSYNGEVTLSLNTTVGTSGAIEAVWIDTKGNVIATPLLIDAGGGMRSQLVTHPRAYCTWQYRLSAAAPAAAHNAFLSVTPS